MERMLEPVAADVLRLAMAAHGLALRWPHAPTAAPASAPPTFPHSSPAFHFAPSRPNALLSPDRSDGQSLADGDGLTPSQRIGANYSPAAHGLSCKQLQLQLELPAVSAVAPVSIEVEAFPAPPSFLPLEIFDGGEAEGLEPAEWEAIPARAAAGEPVKARSQFYEAEGETPRCEWEKGWVGWTTAGVGSKLRVARFGRRDIMILPPRSAHPRQVAAMHAAQLSERSWARGGWPEPVSDPVGPP